MRVDGELCGGGFHSTRVTAYADLLAGGLAAIGLSISVEETKSMGWHRKGHVISQEVYNARQPQPAAETACGVVRWNGEKGVIDQTPFRCPVEGPNRLLVRT